jgi:Ca2+-binding EF-hand superfamily protein
LRVSLETLSPHLTSLEACRVVREKEQEEEIKKVFGLSGDDGNGEIDSKS